MDISHATSDKILARNTLRNLGILAYIRGENAASRKRLMNAADLDRATGGTTELAFIKVWIAKLDIDEGRLADAATGLSEAKEEFSKSHEIASGVKTSALVIQTLLWQGKVEAAQREAESGEALALPTNGLSGSGAGFQSAGKSQLATAEHSP